MISQQERDRADMAFWVLSAVDRFGSYGTTEKAKEAAELLRANGLLEGEEDAVRLTPKGEEFLTSKFIPGKPNP